MPPTSPSMSNTWPPTIWWTRSGSAGEDKTVTIKSQFARIGLQPGNGGDWFQTVPMVETTADESATLDLAVGSQRQVLAFGKDMVVGTRTGQPWST